MNNDNECDFRTIVLMDLLNVCKANDVKRKNFTLLVIAKIFTSRSFRPVFLHRLLNNTIIKNYGTLKLFLWAFFMFFLNCEISHQTKIGGGLYLPHPQCIVIGGSCILGKNVTILQGVTIGGNLGKKKKGRSKPIIGNEVIIGAGAKVLGPLSVGNRSIIGANAVVTKDIPENVLVGGVPAKIIKKIR